jgi:alcohol dehydrogenase, propanol-preferring
MTCTWAGLPYPTPKDQVGGHEGIGKIVKMGPGTESAAVKVGDRVGIKWLAHACGGCPACLEGHDGVCFNQKISGYYHPGTFQQYAIGPAHYVTPIPDSLDSAEAAPMLCAGVTVYSALRKSGTQSGQWVVIQGAGGGLGHLAVQFASKGIGLRVIGVDSAEKEKLVKDSGAEHFIAVGGEKSTADQVKELTGGLGAHAVLVMTAANAAYAEACDLLRFGGTCVCVGIPEHKPVPIGSALPQFMIAKELKIVGVAVGDRRDAIEALDFAARGLVKTHIKIEKMDKLTQIFQDMHEAKLHGRVVLDLAS